MLTYDQLQINLSSTHIVYLHGESGYGPIGPIDIFQLWTLISYHSDPYKFCFYCPATRVTSQVLQPKSVNKWYRGATRLSVSINEEVYWSQIVVWARLMVDICQANSEISFIVLAEHAKFSAKKFYWTENLKIVLEAFLRQLDCSNYFS